MRERFRSTKTKLSIELSLDPSSLVVVWTGVHSGFPWHRHLLGEELARYPSRLQNTVPHPHAISISALTTPARPFPEPLREPGCSHAPALRTQSWVHTWLCLLAVCGSGQGSKALRASPFSTHGGTPVVPMSWWTHPCVISYFWVWTGLTVSFYSMEGGEVIQGHFQDLVVNSQCLTSFPPCLSLCFSLSLSPLLSLPPALCLGPCYLERPTWPRTEESDRQRRTQNFSPNYIFILLLQWGQILTQFCSQPQTSWETLAEASSWATLDYWSQKPAIINVCCSSHQHWEMLSHSNRSLIQSSHTRPCPPHTLLPYSPPTPPSSRTGLLTKLISGQIHSASMSLHSCAFFYAEYLQTCDWLAPPSHTARDRNVILSKYLARNTHMTIFNT